MIILEAFVPAAPASRLRHTLSQETDTALRGRVRSVRQRLEQCAEAVGQQAAEDLAKEVVAGATGAIGAVNVELAGVARVGVVLASARPGVKRIAFVLTDHFAPARRAEWFLTTKPQGGELLLTSERLGKITEVARAELRTPESATALRAAAERFVLEMAEAFVQAY
jgi:hypothetical protein